MEALLLLPRFAGHWLLRWVRMTGTFAVLLARVVRLTPRMDRRELLRALVDFGLASTPLALATAMVTGSAVVLQTSLYTERFGARAFLGWAAGYAALWEIGPLLLGLLFAARVGARNAAQLASLQIGGQLEGLSGISLDPLALLVGPRVWAAVLSILFLCVPAFGVAILFELIAARFTLQLPARVFLSSLRGMLGPGDLLGGVLKTLAYGIAIALVSTSAGLRARGGARAVGRAAASAVVQSAAAIFSLDFLVSTVLAKVAELWR